MTQAIKRLLPKSFKQFLWFVFKSPQRRWHDLGYGTLSTDLKGWLSTRREPVTLRPISICIGVKNRSDNLIDFVVTSARHCEHAEMISLSVFDCGSSDVDDLETLIRNQWEHTLIYSHENLPFARSVAFNRAVRQAKDELILVCDADMSLPVDIVYKVNKYVSAHSAWFPHVWYLNPDGSGRYYTESTGMMACYKQDYLDTGGMDESIREWGKEDWLLFFAFYKSGKACIRSNEREFVHHYHESLKPANFKPLF